jgi:hypothetical protein
MRKLRMLTSASNQHSREKRTKKNGENENAYLHIQPTQPRKKKFKKRGEMRMRTSSSNQHCEKKEIKNGGK